MSDLARRLHQVDPNLKVISGHSHRSRVAQQEFDACTGTVCSSCHREVFRSRDGLCMVCWEKAHEFEIRDKVGALSLLSESVIMKIVHPAKKEK